MGRHRTLWRRIVVHREVTAKGRLLVIGWHSIGDSTCGSSGGSTNTKTFDLAPKGIDLTSHIRIVSFQGLYVIDS